eukprot:654873-Amphidinium_carterae.1
MFGLRTLAPNSWEIVKKHHGNGSYIGRSGCLPSSQILWKVGFEKAPCALDMRRFASVCWVAQVVRWLYGCSLHPLHAVGALAGVHCCP